MMMMPPTVCMITCALLSCSVNFAAAFVPAPAASTHTMTRHQEASSPATGTALNLASDNEGSGGLFGGLFAGGQNKNAAAADPNWDDPNRGIVLFEIPLEKMKVGGIRIALSLHCIGQQNTPNKGTWLARQCDDGVIEMWFNNPDQSGMFSITLTELTGGKGTIAVERHGPRPSLVYQLQESLQLHKVLDELETLAFGNEEEVEEENRLLVLAESDGIESARGKLPARQEE
uniref:Galectin n=1 Tax=Minutocellus polymorphus TaxID=265543 RepID=A0A7S0ADF3_9STRA|mmetsp:Transcript_11564/g.19203  ORF Transcript_11564/g.19203 Transcript_11564/m.19203 type:complete len:231 (+) Transcript_11564:99-791(+)